MLISRNIKKTKVRQTIKIICSAIIFILILVYMFILEPYCFFTSSQHANDITEFTVSKIETFDSTRVSSDNKSIILMLIPRVSSKLIERLKLLDSNFNDNSSTGILFLYTDSLTQAEFLRLTRSMKRQVLFLDVANVFNLFPIGFDTCRTTTSYRVRGKWNYLLMIRFWFKTLFELPHLQQYDYIMRLDDDSKINGPWLNVFDEMRRKNAVYFANDVDVDLEKQLPGTMNMRELTLNYIKINNIKPKQIDMLNKAFVNDTVQNYYNNFEVSKVEFFRRPEVRKWVETIDSSHGIFKYRWGDAVLRYLTMALFAEPNEVLHRPAYNLPYCHKCP